MPQERVRTTDESISSKAKSHDLENRLKFSDTNAVKSALIERAESSDEDLVTLEADDDYEFANNLSKEFQDELDK
ncbi:hypothetical protein ACFQMF_01730 [Halorubrum rutilum]|uniref:Uncharacterized protein n=1 Tax=Halorubrum rutilum TaxID=1364933 RepID=A0ABD6AH65_9EURY|nr:hypothetical protein [Halorubrum rutilum]